MRMHNMHMQMCVCMRIYAHVLFGTVSITVCMSVTPCPLRALLSSKVFSVYRRIVFWR